MNNEDPKKIEPKLNWPLAVVEIVCILAAVAVIFICVDAWKGL